MQANSKVLHYEVSGKGAPAVLLHGYLSSLRYWDSLRSSLEKEYRVIAIDLLGFGDSPKLKTIKYDYDDHISWVKHTLDHCGVEQPAILIGHSMGALLALRYASIYPTAIRKLLLINLPLFRNVTQAHRELAGTNTLYKIGLYYGLHRLVWPMMRNTFSKVVMRKVMRGAFYGIESSTFESNATARSGSLKNIIEDQHSFRDLQQISAPAILVVGKQDRLIYQENARQISPTPQLTVLLTNTAHHSPLEKPNLLLDILKAA